MRSSQSLPAPRRNAARAWSKVPSSGVPSSASVELSANTNLSFAWVAAGLSHTARARRPTHNRQGVAHLQRIDVHVHVQRHVGLPFVPATPDARHCRALLTQTAAPHDLTGAARLPLSNFLPSGSTSLTCMLSSYSTTFAMVKPVRARKLCQRRGAPRAARLCLLASAASASSETRTPGPHPDALRTACSSAVVTQHSEKLAGTVRLLALRVRNAETKGEFFSASFRYIIH